MNLKVLVAEPRGWRKPCGVGAALRRLGLVFQGRPHRGIDDVRNIACILQQVFGGK